MNATAGWLDGQVAVITGAGTGIGAAVAARFVAEGAAVVLTGRRPGPLREVAAALGDRAMAVPADAAAAADMAEVAAGGRGAVRRHRHPGRERGRGRAGNGGRRHRRRLVAGHPRQPDHVPGLGARVPAAARRAARLRGRGVVDSRPVRHAGVRGLRDRQARGDRPGPVDDPRLRPARRPGQHRVPGMGAHPHGRRGDGPARRAARPAGPGSRVRAGHGAGAAAQARRAGRRWPRWWRSWPAGTRRP